MSNNRSVNIILTYMSKLDYNGTESIKELLPELVNIQAFFNYIDDMPFQTI